MRYFDAELRVEWKSDASPVTVADRETEAALRTTLKSAFPEDGFLGEEHGEERGTSGFRWIIDPIDGTRSLALTELLSHLPRGYRYVSLQKEPNESEHDIAAAHSFDLAVSRDLNFPETAALCECLDLVISVDTSIGHLSAALGQRTWILLPFNADCRWLLDRSDSPWYCSAVLYRQSSRGDWRGVLTRVAADLKREFSARRPNRP